MKHRQEGDSQVLAADKVGISERSGRRIEKGQRKPQKSRHWRTRDDPLEDVWSSELVPMLELEPTLTGTTLWEYLDDNYPDQYPSGILRTLQRRVKKWRALHGPGKPVMFRQSLPPGIQGLSDFTHPRTPITIAGVPFQHLIYQFRLAYSGWRSVTIVQGGESYSALADGLQNALHQLGGVPLEHRTDSLTAAWSNKAEQQQLTKAYGDLCDHYAMRPTRNNTGVSHENGAIEVSHASLKHRIDQAVLVRGSSDFASVEAYQLFLDDIVKRLNRYSHTRLQVEIPALQALPSTRFVDFTELTVSVSTSSTISVKRVLYSVPCRLIGERLRVHLYHNRLQCFLSSTPVLSLPRVYPKQPGGRARQIDYRHLIHALSAKPQAFRYSQIRDDILPNDDYRQLWRSAQEQFPPQQACKWIVGVLRIAYDYRCESDLSRQLLNHDARGKLPTLKSLHTTYLKDDPPPDIPLRQHTIDSYSEILKGDWAVTPSTGACYG